MKRFLTKIVMMILLIPSTVFAADNGTREADTVADILARTISYNEVEVMWSWDKIIPQSVFVDFETGDFSQANFTNDADYPWEITQDAYEGTYAAKSTNSGVNNSNHFLEMTVEVPYDGVMSFYHKVESELDFDGGLFFIDGQRMTAITGIIDWEYVEIPVTAGVHTYTWSYTKDFYGDEGEIGSDSYYVDNIVPYTRRAGLPEGWLYYDDGYMLSATGMGQEGADNYWAVCFPDMSAYAGQTLSKVATMLYQGTNATVSVCLGGTTSPGTVMATKSFEVTPQEVVEVELDTPVAIDGTEPLWIVMYNNDAANPAAASAYCGDPNGSWFMMQGGWYDVAMIGVSPRTWIIRGYVEDAEGRTVALSQGDFNPNTNVTDDDKVMSLTPERGLIVGTPARAYRNEYNYNLYKRNIFTGDETVTLAENLTDTVYIDNTWATQETGLYQWGVEVTANNSRIAPIVWSNILEKNMFTKVELQVELNTDESVVGTEITFVNLNEPEYSYNVRLGSTTKYVWDEFRKGTYEYTVHKSGYESDATAEVVEILDETTLTCTLTEIVSPATDLYVSPTGWAMWKGEEIISQGDEFFFDFEDGTTNGWTHIDADGDGLGWANTDEYLAEPFGYESSQSILSASYNNTYGALTPDNYIITAEKYLIGDMSKLTFVVKPSDPSYIAEHYGVAVSLTGNTSPNDFEMIWEETIATTEWETKTIDLSKYSGQEVYIALRHFDCTDNYMVVIDNVTLINASKSSRAIESYTVLLNGVEEATVTDLHYRHEDVTAGETYTTTVIANFASGEAAPVEYTWTAVACDEYEGVSDLDIKYSDGNAMLTWTLPAEALGALVYRDGELLTEEILNDEAYSDPFTAAGTFNYCVEAVYEDYVTSCLQCEEFEYDGVSVKENDANAMRIYPNPVKDNLTITAEAMTRITITNTLGQVMYDEEVVSDNQEINVSQYKAGVYVVRIATETGVIVERVVVNN